jgi:hypothetical protein
MLAGRMTLAGEGAVHRRAAARLAWSLFGVSLLLTGCAVALNVSRPYDTDLDTTAGDVVGGAVMMLIFGWFGALIIARRPGHRIGWILCALGVCLAIDAFANEYAILGFDRYPGAAPGAAGAAWIASWTYAVELGLLAALLILFPTGQPPSRRWWPVLWIAAVAMMLSIVAAVSVWPARGTTEGAEPVGVVFVVFYAAGFIALLGCVVAGGVSLVVRFRQANPDERPQVKLLLFAVVAAVVGAPVIFAVLVLFTVESEVVADFALGIPIALIPIAMGSAILRFRLYDIDRLISRTVAYLLLTVVVTGVYASVVLGAGQLLGDASTRTPSWAVAAATLAAAAIVQPARHRIQGAVDRRFNRRKYDAAKTIEAFSAQLRDELELDALTARLHTVIAETMQPTTSWLWLR